MKHQVLFSQNNNEKYLWMSSAAVVIGALRVNQRNTCIIIMLQGKSHVVSQLLSLMQLVSILKRLNDTNYSFLNGLLVILTHKVVLRHHFSTYCLVY